MLIQCYVPLLWAFIRRFCLTSGQHRIGSRFTDHFSGTGREQSLQCVCLSTRPDNNFRTRTGGKSRSSGWCNLERGLSGVERDGDNVGRPVGLVLVIIAACMVMTSGATAALPAIFFTCFITDIGCCCCCCCGRYPASRHCRVYSCISVCALRC